MLRELRATWREARRCLVRAWRGLRRASGDDAYECYVAHHARRHPGEPLMDRREFYEERQRQKWTGVSRCC